MKVMPSNFFHTLQQLPLVHMTKVVQDRALAPHDVIEQSAFWTKFKRCECARREYKASATAGDHSEHSYMFFPFNSGKEWKENAHTNLGWHIDNRKVSSSEHRTHT